MEVNAENTVISNLKDVGYQGDLLQYDSLHTALELGLKSPLFIDLVVWVSNEIRLIGGLEEKIESCNQNSHGDGIDTSGFMMELSAFLKELGCPYDSLITGHMSSRLQTVESRILLIDYLLSELMTFNMLEIRKPLENAQINLQESTTASTLKQILIALGFAKPPDNISTSILFEKLLTKMKDVTKQTGPKRVGKSMLQLNKPLSQQQWSELEIIQGELEKEYQLRREMLLTRLDVTIQSFQWSDRAKGHEDDISRLYTVKRNSLNSTTAEVRLSHLLAARDDLAILEKTSSANVRKNTKSDVQKVIIGRVPDRGGRPHEQAPPPPEMPSWQQQRSNGPAGGGGGFRGGNRGGQGGGRGGRGGYQQNQQQNRTQGGAYQQTQSNSSGDGGYHGNNTSRVQGQWNQPSGSQGTRGGGYSNRGGGYSNRGGFSERGGQNSGYNQSSGQASNYGQSDYGGRQDESQRSYDNNRQSGGNYQKSTYQNQQQDGYTGNNQGYYNRSNRY